MKKLKNRPHLYYQQGSRSVHDRIRILYPDGTAEWVEGGWPFLDDASLEERVAPCWNTARSSSRSYRIGSTTRREAEARMHSYDKYLGFPVAIFIGNL